MDKIFMETKIRMVMKLKKLSRSAAVEKIASMDAAKKEEEAARPKNKRRSPMNFAGNGEDLTDEERFGRLF